MTSCCESIKSSLSYLTLTSQSTLSSTLSVPTPDTLTENGNHAYSSTGLASLDMFAQCVRGMAEQTCNVHFDKVWEESPERLIALLYNLRDCRKGKGEKLLSRYFLLKLRTSHPLTYLSNLENFIDYGYYKDLCEIAKMVYERKLDYLSSSGNIVELEYFAEILKSDYIKLDKLNTQSDPSIQSKALLTLSGKWAPSEGSHFDKKEFGSQAHIIANLIFNKSKTPLKDYRKMLSSLRQSLTIVENLMASNKWDQIDFGSVPSKAHKLLRKAFGKHQEERYKAYLLSVTKGEAKIKSQGIQPHELVQTYFSSNQIDQTIECQWTDLLNKLKEGNDVSHFSKSLALVDVSGSMNGTPMIVAIALGLVISNLSKSPFNNKCVTFDSNPILHNIVGLSLYDQVNCLKRAPWGGSTDLFKCFKLILDTAIENKIKPEDMVKRFYIFTDMQFNQCQGGQFEWSAMHTTITNLYNVYSYDVPEIVYWNLRDTKPSFPCTLNTKGVALISGFSAELLKVFMHDLKIDPLTILNFTLEPYLPKVIIHECDKSGYIPPPPTSIETAIADTTNTINTLLGNPAMGGCVQQ